VSSVNVDKIDITLHKNWQTIGFSNLFKPHSQKLGFRLPFLI